MLSIFILFSSSISQISSCDNIEEVDQKLVCYGKNQQAISSSIKNPYLGCQFECQQYTDKEKEDCSHKCEQLDYSSKNSEECLLKCANVVDPLNQQQCLSSCRRYKRIDYSSDYTDACERCEDLVSFVRKWFHKYTEEQLAEGFKSACTSVSELFPICQALGTSGFESFVQLLLSSFSNQEICQKMNLCSQ